MIRFLGLVVHLIAASGLSIGERASTLSEDYGFELVPHGTGLPEEFEKLVEVGPIAVSAENLRKQLSLTLEDLEKCDDIDDPIRRQNCELRRSNEFTRWIDILEKAVRGLTRAIQDERFWKEEGLSHHACLSAKNEVLRPFQTELEDRRVKEANDECVLLPDPMDRVGILDENNEEIRLTKENNYRDV